MNEYLCSMLSISFCKSFSWTLISCSRISRKICSISFNNSFFLFLSDVIWYSSFRSRSFEIRNELLSTKFSANCSSFNSLLNSKLIPLKFVIRLSPCIILKSRFGSGSIPKFSREKSISSSTNNEMKKRNFAISTAIC
ncbi:hypothetical protein SDC9_47848 [bioreactor metagenome]|uniref:Uncharacterized protein n=1 Tax=bioreactor metagenome TaxID=1076179 RepID=A0A644WDN0_9ZZZZ